MQIESSIHNSASTHTVSVSTDGRTSSLSIPGRAGGGSALNGGELLCAALATCYCNDLYREAASRGMVIREVMVKVEAEFGKRGEAARKITYSAQVKSDASPEEINALLTETDAVAEVHNTLRTGTAVELIR